MSISSFISGLSPHFIHPRSSSSSGTCSLHLRGGRRHVCGCFPEVETQLYQLCPCVVETRRMRSHTSPRWNRHWQDALFVRCNGVIGGPKELRQSQKRWCVGGCLLGVTSPVLKLWFTSFSHRTAKERCSYSFHGGENGCQWKWGYSHFTLCLYLPSPSCRISFEIYHRRLLATSPQY